MMMGTLNSDENYVNTLLYFFLFSLFVTIREYMENGHVINEQVMSCPYLTFKLGTYKACTEQ